MIYFVSNNKPLFNSSNYTLISVEQSLYILKDWKTFMFDTEGTGLDCHIAKVLLMQFGRMDKSCQIVVDCTSVNPILYKDIIENSFIVGQNLKYDAKMLMAIGIFMKRIYDTMIAEQLMYFGFPRIPISPSKYKEKGYDFPYHVKHTKATKKKPSYTYYELSFALDALGYKYLGVNIDKSIRGSIKYLGITDEVIVYGANDVLYLGDIMRKQVEYFKSKNALKALQIECNAVLSLAYFEYCGVKLNTTKWMELYSRNCKLLREVTDSLNKFVVNLNVKRFQRESIQLDLFEEVDVSNKSKCSINWNSTDDVVPLLQYLGFNTKGWNKDKKEETESKGADLVKKQKHINPEFASLYLEYSRLYKLCSTYGPQYVNAVNPKTGRIHTEFRQLDTVTGRLSCGSQKINEDLASLKKLPLKPRKGHPEEVCSYPQIQNLPNTDEVRSCFIAEEGNDFISIDYNSEESRLLASLSKDKGMLEVFEKGYDMHSYVAYLIYPEKIPRDTDIKLIKKLFPHERQSAKGPEFTFAFLGTWATLVANYGMPKSEAMTIENNYKQGFAEATAYQEKCKKYTESTGIIPICKETGHFSRWWDWQDWYIRQHSQEFWDEYRDRKQKGLPRTQEAEEHFKARNKYDKNSVNSTTQGLGAVIFKEFTYALYIWILSKGYQNKVKFCIPVHDEICEECPKELTEEVVKVTKYYMQTIGEKYCHNLPLPAEEEVSYCWVH
jgi:DNA polymerase I-like protein with 3'-5' exonuclease and polymerase domains